MPRSSLKCFICVVLSVVALWLIALSNLTAQTTEGREFWLAFQKNFRDSIADDRTDEVRPSEPLHLSVTITARERAHGYLEASGIGLRQEFTIEAGEAQTFKIDAALQLVSSGKVEAKSLHVVSDAPISVYAANHRYQTTDTYLALPTDALGITYRAMGYKWLTDDLVSQFAVVASEDNTSVVITPSVRTEHGESAGRPFTVQLNKGQTYQVIQHFDPKREGDLTGSLVIADKPIAFFSGHNCAYVPDRTWKACNLLVEQLPPFETWGDEFVVGNFAGRVSSVVRVVAHQNETDLFENGNKVATLDEGEFYENPNLMTATVVTSSKPVLLTQFSKGFTARVKEQSVADSVGDPMMILIPPTDQYLNSYRFATPFSGSWEHYVNVTVAKENAAGIILDGKAIPKESFKQIPGTNFVVAQVKVENGSHVLEGKQPFGLYSYGFGFAEKIFDAYGNNCGQGLASRNNNWIPEQPKAPSISQAKSSGDVKKQPGANAAVEEIITVETADLVEIVPEASQQTKTESVQTSVEPDQKNPKIEYRRP